MTRFFLTPGAAAEGTSPDTLLTLHFNLFKPGGNLGLDKLAWGLVVVL